MIPHFNDTLLSSTRTSTTTVAMGPVAAASSSPISTPLHSLKHNNDDDRASKRQRGNNNGSSGGDNTSDSDNNTSENDNKGQEPAALLPNEQQKQSLEAMLAKKYRHVRFASVTDIHSTERTQEEVNSGWYNKDELAHFKTERKSLVKALKKVNFDLNKFMNYNVDEKHCLRGFEAYFSIQANKEYKAKRQMVLQAVLQEQRRQKYLNIHDNLMMQLVSSHASQWARDTATDLGMADAQMALQIFMESYNAQQQVEEEEEEEEYKLEEVEFDDDITSALLMEDIALEEEETEPQQHQEQEDAERQQLYSSSSEASSASSSPLQADDFEPLQLSSHELSGARLVSDPARSHSPSYSSYNYAYRNHHPGFNNNYETSRHSPSNMPHHYSHNHHNTHSAVGSKTPYSSSVQHSSSSQLMEVTARTC